MTPKPKPTDNPTATLDKIVGAAGAFRAAIEHDDDYATVGVDALGVLDYISHLAHRVAVTLNPDYQPTLIHKEGHPDTPGNPYALTESPSGLYFPLTVWTANGYTFTGPTHQERTL